MAATLEDKLVDAVQHIAAGGIVAVPTESSFGLAVDPFNRSAVRKLRRLKQRPDGPISLIIPDLASLRALGVRSNLPLRVFAEAFWPGPLTLALPSRSALAVGHHDGSVAVRISSHPVAQALAATLGQPITATSANPRQQKPAMRAAEVHRYFGGAVHTLDIGIAWQQRASTLVTIAPSRRPPYAVLRSGPVTQRRLAHVLDGSI